MSGSKRLIRSREAQVLEKSDSQHDPVIFFQGPVGEVGGVRLPLQSLHGYGSVFMYSASTSPGGGGGQGGGGGGEVTLRLREPEDIPEEVLARLEDTATLSISLQGDAVLRLGAAGTGKSSVSFFLRVTCFCSFLAVRSDSRRAARLFRRDEICVISRN